MLIVAYNDRKWQVRYLEQSSLGLSAILLNVYIEVSHMSGL